MSLSGSILLCGVAIAVSAYLLWRSERKQAAVGRRYAEVLKFNHKNANRLVKGDATVPDRLYHHRDLRDLHGGRIPS